MLYEPLQDDDKEEGKNMKLFKEALLRKYKLIMSRSSQIDTKSNTATEIKAPPPKQILKINI